ncbi:stealth conserved region 3 domain-containing protein [Modicisalibacter radicis]|uniref:stealth conserved region 3 domain-containing protein n=1 Tax=Halomonas sp. EAR18 TaxID=2518972 RepID=UPI00109C7435|nr:stealth conserved region 3 domain-containing protein [Halomonas sp. EAR18]
MSARKIDFVITWLDPSDPDWQRQYKETAASEKYREIADFSPGRYRDWDNLRYWFRGVEKYAPWVNRIHFVTYGHLPAWLNPRHPRLNIVRHADYIDACYLPTFNSRVLELNLVHLESLAEHFVLFNDDFFVIDRLDPEMLFHRGLPRDFAILNAYSGDGLSPVLMNNMKLLNRRFDKRTTMKKHLGKWFSPAYRQHLARTLLLLPWPRFTGFQEPHLPQPYLKSNLQETWAAFGDEMARTCRSRFRLTSDTNHYLFRYHHLVNGRFSPTTPRKHGTYYEIANDNYLEVSAFIESQKTALLTINDADIDDFETVKASINTSLAKLFPAKSAFER